MKPPDQAKYLLLLGLCGCPKKAEQAPPPALVVAPEVTPAPAGQVTDGVYSDSLYPLTITVPPGWKATPGLDADAERVTFDAPDGYARVVIAAVPGERLEPRPHPGCTWSFSDTAWYRAPKVVGTVLVATCTPERLTEARILAYVMPHEGVTWHIEGTLAPGHLPVAKTELDVIAAAVRFR